MVHYGHMFRLLHCACSQSITSALGQMELTSAQGRVLGYLARQKQPPCAKDIEEEFRLSHSTVSGLLSRLEKKKFIEIRQDEKDGRVKRICISPRGLDCDGKILKILMENEERVVRGFTEAEREQFADLLIRAVRNMGSDPGIHSEEEEPNT